MIFVYGLCPSHILSLTFHYNCESLYRTSHFGNQTYNNRAHLTNFALLTSLLYAAISRMMSEAKPHNYFHSFLGRYITRLNPDGTGNQHMLEVCHTRLNSFSSSSFFLFSFLLWNTRFAITLDGYRKKDSLLSAMEYSYKHI